MSVTYVTKTMKSMYGIRYVHGQTNTNTSGDLYSGKE